MTTWAHLHLPRLTSGDPNPISVKVPGERIDYVSWLSLTDVTFRVSQAGRRRCLREDVRNVHAWVVGTEVLRAPDYPFADPALDYPTWRRAVYDPWKGHAFVDAETLAPVLTARYAILSGKHVFYVGWSS
jgi:hypothetical protein